MAREEVISSVETIEGEAEKILEKARSRANEILRKANEEASKILSSKVTLDEVKKEREQIIHKAEKEANKEVEESKKKAAEVKTATDKEVEKIEQGEAWDETDAVKRVEVKKPLDKVIPVRLPSDKWEQIRVEARELGVGPTTLARMWILERLRERVKA